MSKAIYISLFLNVVPSLAPLTVLKKLLSWILVGNRRGKKERNGKSLLHCALLPLHKHCWLLSLWITHDHSQETVTIQVCVNRKLARQLPPRFTSFCSCKLNWCLKSKNRRRTCIMSVSWSSSAELFTNDMGVFELANTWVRGKIQYLTVARFGAPNCTEYLTLIIYKFSHRVHCWWCHKN